MDLEELLSRNKEQFFTVVPFERSKDRLLQLHFTASNASLNADIVSNTEHFSNWVEKQLGSVYRYGIGGYDELRTIYARSDRFDAGEEPRRLHLGIDIWGRAGTEIMAPLSGTVHSFANNDYFGDYGATIILQHQLEGYVFYTLYGHLSLSDIKGLHVGKEVAGGDVFAHFGPPEENGNWPPHLHFQIIHNLGNFVGDFPGVCKFSEREQYLQNCPKADLILQMMQFAE